MYRSDLVDVQVGGATVPELVFDVARRSPDRVALVDPQARASVTYETLARRINQISAGLSERGLGVDDVVALWSPNRIPWAACALGAMTAGCAVTGIGAAATDREVRVQLQQSGAQLLVADDAVAARAVATRDAGLVAEAVTLGQNRVDGATPVELLMSMDAPAPVSLVSELAVAALPFSSGTTGVPKAVQLTHRSLVTIVRQTAAALALGEDDVVLALPPFAHVMGLVLTMLLPLSTGARVVTVPRFEPDSFLELLEVEGVTVLIAPPPIAPLLAAGAKARSLRLRLAAFGGAPLSASRQQQVMDALPGCEVGQGWGMTELAVGATCPSTTLANVPGAAGRLLPNTELRVVDPASGLDVDSADTGELWVRGPQTTIGYLGRPDETAKLIDADGWVHTGDIGRISDGWVYVVDRLKDLIKVRGYQVAPAEVEAVLFEHPDVVDAAVTAVATGQEDEAPVGFVVARDPSTFDADAVRRWVASQVAPYKHLHHIYVCDAIPRTPSGKVLRRELVPEGGDEHFPQPACTYATGG